MASALVATRGPQLVEASPAPPEDILESFTGSERILGIVPFMADVSTAPRWHHLLFTEDKVLAVRAFPEPAPGAEDLFLPPRSRAAEAYPTVHAALGLVAIPQPLMAAHVTSVVPYAQVRRARLLHAQGPDRPSELEIRAGRLTTWWFFQKDDAWDDPEKACFARDLLLRLLPFPLELVGFDASPRPQDRRLRRRVREPLPLLGSSVARTPGEVLER